MTRTERHRRTSLLKLLSLLAAFLLIAAACGDSSGDSDGDTAAGDESSDDGGSDDGGSDDGDDEAMAEDGDDEAMEEDDEAMAEDGDDEAMEEDDEAMEEDDEAMAEDDGGSEGGETLRVAMVNNQNMVDACALAPDHFTPDSGITVDCTIMEEQELREVTTLDVTAGGDQFDVVQIGMFEAPQFGRAGNLVDLNTFAEGDADYNVDDLIPAVRSGLSFDGGLYASPFYAESSFVMYRADVMEENGIDMPDAPTWDQIAEIARQIDSDEMAGICLRGKPGWGDLGAAFTTVLNTFGGTWWAANDDGSIGASQVDQPEFKEALEFYVNLLADAGEDDAANSSFNECLTLYKEGKVAMWYDATVAAGFLEADDSEVKGLNDFALAPVQETDGSGWLWSWALGIPTSTDNQEAAWEFVSWVTSAEYIALTGTELESGWAAIPPGTRTSTYAIPEYQEAAASFADKTLDAMNAAPIDNPGTTPRPGLPGVQYVGVPEFQEVGTACTELFSAVIAGNTSVDDAISQCHDIASEFSN